MINIAEILKDCPSGMELDCTMFECIEFDSIIDNENFPICCRIKNSNDEYNFYSFTKYGCWNNEYKAKCVIFPKDKTTWEGFIPPCEFKDGDVIFKDNFIAILSHIGLERQFWYHCWYHTKSKCCKFKKDFGIGHINDDSDIRIATEEEKEKQKLFDAIKESGYKWNAETKTLEKLSTPKFKVGDKIKHKSQRCDICTVKDIQNNQYIFEEIWSTLSFDEQHHYELVLDKVEPKFKVGDRIRERGSYISGVVVKMSEDNYYKVKYKGGGESYVNIKAQDNWELIPNKFDINTLVPFESKVLVRDDEKEKWKPAIWGYYDTDHSKYYPYETVGGNCFVFCIPYEGNEHLLGTTEDCDEFYKNW